MFHDESLDSIQLFGAETPIPLESHGIKPKFSLVALMAHVNVDGLRTVNCVEEEAIRSDPKDGRHPIEMGASGGRSHGGLGLRIY